ncbi:N-acyl-aromatic-L-amino acid amidohydrolase (carboxylate-forming) B-like [Eucyclogobius newberryi]|uniref:N-acyl-aromatic-L-amino acid amidohydrolase (carboxylate-forming) B-like n=1 Tax=Eucyclogobius newberryi TaxID=166745 RepID=UPI003B5B7BF9
MDHISFPPFSRVVISGGTHGNELSGVYLVQEMQRHNVAQVGSLSISSVLNNPPAIHACRRYMDKDLNRCFTDALLSAALTDASPSELRRAHELNALLGPKGSERAVDLLCDLHNTTSNMGLCFIIDSIDLISLHIAKYVQSKMPSAPTRVIHLDVSKSEAYSVDSVAKHGFSIEVGPQPHGVLRADIYNMMKEAVDHTLEWINRFNAGASFEGGDMEVFGHEKSVDYPRDPETGQLVAAVHPELQDNDFKLLQHGDPIFMSFTGDTVNYEGEELYPFFINECAYYEKKIAFHLAKRPTVTLPPISMKKDEN